MSLYPFNGITPKVAASAFVAPGARVIGDVSIGADSSIWYNVVLRGDVERIVIGDRTNIQDGSVVHVTRARHGTEIGDDVLIGHLAMVHGCVIENHGYIGLGAIIMDECVVESDGMLAAGALLTPGKRIRNRELWTGRPAKLARLLTDAEIRINRAGCAGYVQLAQLHKQSTAGG